MSIFPVYVLYCKMLLTRKRQGGQAPIVFFSRSFMMTSRKKHVTSRKEHVTSVRLLIRSVSATDHPGWSMFPSCKERRHPRAPRRHVLRLCSFSALSLFPNFRENRICILVVAPSLLQCCFWKFGQPCRLWIIASRVEGGMCSARLWVRATLAATCLVVFFLFFFCFFLGGEILDRHSRLLNTPGRFVLGKSSTIYDMHFPTIII